MADGRTVGANCTVQYFENTFVLHNFDVDVIDVDVIDVDVTCRHRSRPSSKIVLFRISTTVTLNDYIRSKVSRFDAFLERRVAQQL